jgi:hypothetical protein
MAKALRNVARSTFQGKHVAEKFDPLGISFFRMTLIFFYTMIEKRSMYMPPAQDAGLSQINGK